MTGRSIEFGWGAPSFAQQLPGLSSEDAAAADAFNQAIIRLSVHGLLSGAERDRAIKRTTRWIEERVRARHQRASREDRCQCGACTPDAAHASDCGVHAAPASPAGPCTCSAPGIEAQGATTEGRGAKHESPVGEAEAPASLDQDPAPRPSQEEQSA